MKPLEDIYKGGFFKIRHKLAWRVPILCAAVFDVLEPKTLVDVGCATADLVEGFIGLGVDAYGLEGSSNCVPFLRVPKEKVLIMDLRLPIPYERSFDVALCLEVAEHIEPEYSDQFVRNLSKLSNSVVLTAAPPGQGGHYHVNCQPKEYWIDKMWLLGGYSCFLDIAEEIKAGFGKMRHKKEMSAWHNNMLFFRRAGSDA